MKIEGAVTAMISEYPFNHGLILAIAIAMEILFQRD